MITIRDRYLRLNKDGVYEPVANAKIVLQADTAPLSVDSGSGFQLVESPFTVETRTDSTGWWQFSNVPWPAESNPNTVKFIVSFPDRVAYIGVVPAIAGPVTIDTLVNSHGWGLVNPSYGGQVSAIVGQQGPQGIQGPPGADGQQGPPGQDGADGAPGITDLVTQSVNGIMRAADKKKLDWFVSVVDFGADPTGVADSGPAIQAAIESFDVAGSKAGTVYFPYGVFRIATTVVVQRAVNLQGSGGSRFYPGTTLLCDPGITAFRFYTAQNSPTGRGSDWCSMRDIHVLTNGRRTARTTGTFYFDATPEPPQAPEGRWKIDVADRTSFNVRDMVAVQGAGQVSIMYGCRATTTAGNPIISITQNPGSNGPHGFIAEHVPTATPGTTIKLEGVTFGGGKTYTHCIAVDEITPAPWQVTLADAPDQTVSNIQVEEIEPRYCEIMEIVAGAGTTGTLKVDQNNTNGYLTPATLTNRTITHANPGVLMRSRCHIADCSMVNHTGFGLMIIASRGFTPPSNCNSWKVDNITALGNLGGIYLEGNDVNAGTAVCCDVSGNRGWGLIDASVLGTQHMGHHISGGRGYKVCQEQIANSVFVSCYEEGGSFSTFSNSTMILGGIMGRDEGGQTLSNFPPGWHTRFNMGDVSSSAALRLGEYEYALMPFGLQKNHGQRPALWKKKADGIIWPGSVEWHYIKTRSSTDGVGGWWGLLDPSAGPSSMGLLQSDADATGGKSQVWLPGGLLMGTQATGALDINLARRVEVRGGVPTLGTDAPIRGGSWRVGDRVLKSLPFAEGASGAQTVLTGWICTGAGVPGTWIEDRSWAAAPTAIPTLVASTNEQSCPVGYTLFWNVPFAQIPAGGANYQVNIYMRVSVDTTIGATEGLRLIYWDGASAERRIQFATGLITAGRYEFTRFINVKPLSNMFLDISSVGTAGQIFISSTLHRMS